MNDGPETRPAAVIGAVAALAPFLLGTGIIAPFGQVLYGGDDWAYAWSVRHLLETNELQISEWASAAVVPQILWGALFSRALGFSLRTLNLSVLGAAVIGALALYQLLHELGFQRGRVIAATAAVTATPLYLGLAGSFMSDMIYAVLMLGVALCYVRALHTGSWIAAAAGGMLTSAALLQRQLGIVLWMAYLMTVAGIWLWRTSPTERKALLGLGLSGAIMPPIVFALSRVRPDLFGGNSIAQSIILDRQSVLAMLFNVPRTLLHIIVAWNYLVVLLLPLLVPFLWPGDAREPRRAPKAWMGIIAIVASLLASEALCYLWYGGFVLPGDLFHIGVRYGDDGPLTVWIWTGLVLGSIAPGVLVLMHCRDRFVTAWRDQAGIHDWRGIAGTWGMKPENAGRWFLILSLLGQGFLSLSHVSFSNNYFLPMLPLVAIGMLVLFERSEFRAGLAGVMIAISLGSSALYLQSKARYVEASWRTADRLARESGDARRVFAWPSWYGWNNYDAVIADLRTYFSRGDREGTLHVLARARDAADYCLVGSRGNDLMRIFGIADIVKYDTYLGVRDLYIVRRAPGKPAAMPVRAAHDTR